MRPYPWDNEYMFIGFSERGTGYIRVAAVSTSDNVDCPAHRNVCHVMA